MAGQIIPLYPQNGQDASLVQGIPVSVVDPTSGQILVYDTATRQYVPTDYVGKAGGTFTGNLTLNGTANTAPNQTAASGSSLITRDLFDARLVDSSCIIFKDDFSTGGRTGLAIGETGWGISGTGASIVERGTAGVYPNQTTQRLTTGATAGQFARIYTANSLLGGASNWTTITGWQARLIFALPAVTSVTFACGFSTNPNATDFADRLVGVRFKSGVDTNYQFICKNDTSTFALSASSTLVDSGVAAQNNVFVRVDMQCVTAGTIQFSINGGSWSSVTTNIPTSMTGLLYFWVEPTTNSARYFDVDFASWKVDVTR